MGNGWVAPCPYFPLVFGDAKREPIIDVFERIQSHPLIRLGGESCPMRNTKFIDEHIRDMGIDRPFFPITVSNQIDLASTCHMDCPDCASGARPRPGPADDIIRAIGEIDAEYTRIEFYGGDALLRDDLARIFDSIPPGKKIVIWSACSHLPTSAAVVERLRSYPIEAIKVHLPVSLFAAEHPAEQAADFDDALNRMRYITAWSFPVHLYVPDDLLAQVHPFVTVCIQQLGVERLYAFTRNPAQPLVNSVGCFGRQMGQARILWADNRRIVS
jgi:hypothetical protein